MDKIFIIGASEHAKYTIDIVEQEQKHQIAGIFDDALPKNSRFEGYKVLGKIENLAEISDSLRVKKGIIAIGDNYTRLKIYERITKADPHFGFVSAIHPSVILGKNVSIGNGSLLMAGVIINNNTKVGEHAFIATKTSIDHDSELDDFCSFSPGCTTGGSIKVGFCSAVCLSAGIIHGIRIGKHSVIGAGSIVNKNIDDYSLAYGIPAKRVRQREEGDRYL